MYSIAGLGDQRLLLIQGLLKYILQANLDLAMFLKLASNSRSCLHLSSAGIIGTQHHAQLKRLLSMWSGKQLILFSSVIMKL